MYFLNHHGTTSGPFSEAEFSQMLISGQVEPADLIWKEGEPEWRPATDYPGPGRLAAPVLVSPAPSQGPRSPYAPPVAEVAVPEVREPIPKGAWLAVLATFLFWPLGIAAVSCAVSGGRKERQGNAGAAAVARKQARLWTWLGIGIGVPLNILVGYWMMADVSGYFPDVRGRTPSFRSR